MTNGCIKYDCYTYCTKKNFSSEICPNTSSPRIREHIGSVIGGRVPATQGSSGPCVYCRKPGVRSLFTYVASLLGKSCTHSQKSWDLRSESPTTRITQNRCTCPGCAARLACKDGVVWASQTSPRTTWAGDLSCLFSLATLCIINKKDTEWRGRSKICLRHLFLCLL